MTAKRTKALEEQILAHYNTGATDAAIAETLGIRRHVVIHCLRSRSLAPNKSADCLTKYNGYFSTIDTWEKAYVLGFICADGYVGKRGLEIYINEKDRPVLEFIKRQLETDAPITVSRSNKTGTYVRLRPSNKHMVADLEKQGAIRKKSLVLEWPQHVPDHLLWPFVLGYFDGNGTIGLYKIARKNRSGNSLSPTMRPVIAIWCSWSFAQSLHDFLQKHSVHVTIHSHKGGKIAFVRTMTFRHCQAWLQQMYDGYRFCLDRKHQIASEILNHNARLSDSGFHQK